MDLNNQSSQGLLEYVRDLMGYGASPGLVLEYIRDLLGWAGAIAH